MDKNEDSMNIDYGICDYCGGELYPVWFTEEETNIEHGSMYKTGRRRRAVSHLVCEQCLKNFVVDDSFDGPWTR